MTHAQSRLAHLRTTACTALLLAMSLAAGCQLLSGADDLEFAPPASTVASGGSGGMGDGGVGGDAGEGGSVTSTGGGGAAPECVVASDCPGVETDCAFRSCDDGTCGMGSQLAGAACDEQGGAVCDGAGKCVECLSMLDCEQTFTCDRQVCVPGQCVNNMVDGDESDVDCGGTMCAPCENGESCVDYLDCGSSFCNGQQCGACLSNSQCAAAGDAYCQAGVCIAQKAVGTACNDDGECLDDQCVDGVCCDSGCGGKCRACNLPGSVGSCSNIPGGQDPNNECLLSCNGNGGCQL